MCNYIQVLTSWFVSEHVAALLFQILDYKELELTEVPVELSCTAKLQSWNVPSVNSEKKGAVLFEDLLFEQADYSTDKYGVPTPPKFKH